MWNERNRWWKADMTNILWHDISISWVFEGGVGSFFGCGVLSIALGFICCCAREGGACSALTLALTPVPKASMIFWDS